MLPTLLGLATVLAAPAIKEPPKKDVPAIVGKWTVESIELAGTPVPQPQTDLTVTFAADGTFTSQTPRNAEPTQKGTYTVDAKKNPHELDITEGAGKPEPKPAIFKIEKDTLTICVALDGGRPTSFDGKDAKAIVMIFKRVKD
jgi:uncharacterized protein (TIGR03067 family)